MNTEILATAPLPVIIHIIAALYCIGLGGYMLYAKKGSRAHKIMGWSWVSSMSIVIFSAFFIHGFEWIGPFSPIHLIISFAIMGLWTGIRDIRAKKVQAHREAMLSMYWGALGVPFMLALLPGRRLNMLLFEDGTLFPSVLLALLLVIVGAYLRWEKQLKHFLSPHR
ncbi:DUF2306 domain-containing protein [Maritalea mediterranea]|uniref:DUF2306 domain-containing protein n=1 Tax=Maritalea mediterranea TaxID=2909667 RepID=A0ABS9E3D4_9HYPH|nr:DUF2306 domain-containing protein [Maritalea mediterranea]MCF4097322.1 DUF2306 domain-containing protein [Maritalea mediterranea]